MPKTSDLAQLACLLLVPSHAAAEWYDGIDGIKVLAPGDANAQAVCDQIAAQQHSDVTGQFNAHRYALLLLSGAHNISINTGYYTSVIGVGAGPASVTVRNVESFDVEAGGATQNFWRSAEGLTVKNSSSTWAVSQACPLRRMVYEGDLWLSEQGPGTHWSSGGFLADVQVGGTLHTGTQQQWLFRNSELGKPGQFEYGGWNYVFVGVDGAPTTSTTGKPDEITTIARAPAKAEKPYLVRADNKLWQIWVPQYDTEGSSGVTPDYAAAATLKLTLETDVFVARASQHSGSSINAALTAKAFTGLLLTPGIYDMDEPIRLTAPGFVVLGIGFPTLVTSKGQAAVEVSSGLADVRIAGVLLESGTPATDNGTVAAVAPLLRWGESATVGLRRGSAATATTRSVMSDIFARVGAFSYTAGSFKASCTVTTASSHVEINDDGLTVDNTWFWHADHDDCGSASDRCYSAHGLTVNGDDVTVMGLAAEHTMEDLVVWKGERGTCLFYQSELPYHDASFSGVGYAVNADVKAHKAYGVGVYIIGGGLHVKSAIRAPSTANFTNMLTLVLGGSTSQFGSMLCDGAGQCLQPDTCNAPGCYLHSNGGHSPSPSPPVPSPPTPPPTPAPAPTPPVPADCIVGSDAFLPGQAGTDSPTRVNSKEGCANACVAFASLPCKYFKFGTNGDWCQLFSNDGGAGWPIAHAANSSSSVVFSGTVPGNNC